jgi:HD-GYP domain-containing protein (c-di-GMP phosphodiesterase class II)
MRWQRLSDWNQGYGGSSLLVRIFSIADAYELMISDRIYRQAINRNKAMAEIRRCAGS